MPLAETLRMASTFTFVHTVWSNDVKSRNLTQIIHLHRAGQNIVTILYVSKPVPVAAQSEEYVLIPVIVGSNPAYSMIFVIVFLCCPL
jgi:hypothetical protein